jgi:hypothetical protein
MHKEVCVPESSFCYKNFTFMTHIEHAISWNDALLSDNFPHSFVAAVWRHPAMKPKRERTTHTAHIGKTMQRARRLRH